MAEGRRAWGSPSPRTHQKRTHACSDSLRLNPETGSRACAWAAGGSGSTESGRPAPGRGLGRQRPRLGERAPSSRAQGIHTAQPHDSAGTGCEGQRGLHPRPCQPRAAPAGIRLQPRPLRRGPVQGEGEAPQSREGPGLISGSFFSILGSDPTSVEQ